MKLEALNLDTLRQAVIVYLEIAWPGKREEKELAWGEDREGEALLDLFQDESPTGTSSDLAISAIPT